MQNYKDFKQSNSKKALNRLSEIALVSAFLVLAAGCQSVQRQGSVNYTPLFRAISSDINQRQYNINEQNRVQNNMILRQRTYQPAQRACAWNDYWCQTGTKGHN